MNWSRTKTWLIILFIGLNLFLILTLVKNNIAISTVSEQAIQDTVAILARNGIYASPESIPRKMPALSAVEVYNTIADPEKIATALLGGKANYHQESNQYMYGSAIVQFGGDNIRYTNINPSQSNVYTNEEKAIAAAKAFLTSAGFPLEKAEATLVRYDAKEAYVLFSQKLDSYPLLDSQFHVIITDKGVSTMEGCWFHIAAEQSGATGARGRVKEITSVLIDFMNDENRSGQSNSIVNITLGYTTGDKNTYHKSVSALPAWRITTTDGRTYYYEAH